MSLNAEHLIIKLRKFIISFALLLLVLVALFVSIGRQLIVLVDDYKYQLTNTLSETLKTPVTIGRLEGGWSILSPTITAYDIHIGDDKRNLRVKQLTIETDLLSSLLNQQVKIASIQAEELQLQVVENVDGNWSVGGIPRQKDPITPEIILTQLQHFKKATIVNSTITVYPYQQISREFTHVNATLKQLSTNHLKLDGVLYINNEHPFVVSLNTFITPHNWKNLDAKLYVDIPYIDWLNWLPKNLSSSWQIKQLRVGGEIWASIKKGQIDSTTVQTKNNELAIQHAKNKIVNIKDIAFRAWLKNDDQQTQFQISNLQFITDKTTFKDLDLLLTHNKSDNDAEQWQFKANTISIDNFIPPVQALAPLPPIANEIIDAINPKGIIRNLTFNWYPKKPFLEQLQLSANLENVAFSPYKNTVGAGNITGSIEGSIGQGQLKLNTQNFSLFIEKLYPNPWSYHTAKAALNWSFDNEAFSLYSPLMQLTADEGKLAGDMMIRLYPKNPLKDYMDLRVNIANGDASYTHKYLPTKANGVSKDLLHWLTTAIKSGYIEHGFFQYQGSLDKDTPAVAHSLLLYMQTRDTEINYQPPWYPIKQVAGEVFVEPSGVRIIASQGTISESNLTNIKINIPHVNEPQITHLYLNSDISSTVTDTLYILKSAPPEISQVFKNWQGSGNLVGKVHLNIPLKKNQKPIVITDFITHDAQLNLQYPIPPLSQITGAFNYDSTKGLSSDKVTAYSLGEALQGSITAEGKNGEAISYIKAEGIADIKKLTNWFTKENKDWPVTGKTPYRLDLWLAKENNLEIKSQLQGITLDLPAPFTKEKKQLKEFSWKMQFADDRETLLQISYDDFISSSLAIQANNPQSIRGQVLLNQGIAVLDAKEGLQVEGNLITINLESWKKIIDNYLPSTDIPSHQTININFLRSVDLRVGQVEGFGLPPQQAAIYLQPTGQQGWRLDIDSPTVAGRITAPQIDDLPYYVNLKHLKIPTELLSQSKHKTSLNTFDLKQIPSVNLFVQQVFIGDDLLGNIHLINTPTEQGLQLSNISTNFKGLNIIGQLDWQKNQSSFQGQLKGKNLASVLQNWGFEPTITTKSFKVDINGSWPGAPTDFTLNKFSGQVASTLKSGRLITIDGSATNVLRVFGILNSEAIMRRLRLDFSDLYRSGLSYDQIKGKFTATNGIFRTITPLELEGPSMLMSMTGEVNMQTQQINATLKAGIPLGSNISIATLAVAPPIGGAMLIVDHFFGDELMKLAAVTYSIKGNWSNPTISLGH